MELDKTALAILIPTLILGFFEDSGVHIGPIPILKVLFLAILIVGSACTLAAWFQHPAKRGPRLTATILYAGLDALVLFVYVRYWMHR